MFLDSEAVSAQGFHAVPECWRPSSGRGQDALENRQSDMLPMAGGGGNACRRACKATPPHTSLLSSKPPALLTERDFLSRLLIPVYLFIFVLAIMGAGFAVVAKHISFLFLLSLS